MELATIDGEFDALILRLGELLAKLGVLDDHGKEVCVLGGVGHGVPCPARGGAAGLPQPTWARYLISEPVLVIAERPA